MYSLKEGFVEALVRGKKTELLSAEDYDKLRHCESLADFKAYLTSRGYSEPENGSTICDANSLVNHCTTKFVKSYKQLLSHVRLWNIGSLSLFTLLNRRQIR